MFLIERRLTILLLAVGMSTSTWLLDFVIAEGGTCIDPAQRIFTNTTFPTEWKVFKTLVSPIPKYLAGCNRGDIVNATFWIRHDQEDEVCHGIALTQHIGLTASHCLFDTNKRRCYRGITASSKTQQEIRSFFHPGFHLSWDGKVKYDLGVVVTAGNLKSISPKHRSPLKCLLVSEEPSNNCRIIETHTILNKRLTLTNECGNHVDQEDSIMCVRTNDGSPLQAKSGSPVFCKHGKKRWYVRGVVSYNMTQKFNGQGDNTVFVATLSDFAKKHIASCECPNSSARNSP